MRTRKVAPVAVGLVLMLAASACSGGDDPESSSGGEEAAPPASASGRAACRTSAPRRWLSRLTGLPSRSMGRTTKCWDPTRYSTPN